LHLAEKSQEFRRLAESLGDFRYGGQELICRSPERVRRGLSLQEGRFAWPRPLLQLRPNFSTAESSPGGDNHIFDLLTFVTSQGGLLFALQIHPGNLLRLSRLCRRNNWTSHCDPDGL
jgi:hypothetical protein